jgi:tetratricopeptide (TPR) repeat protein
MGSLIRSLLERRLPQYLLLYMGCAWGVMQFTQFIVDVYLLSPHWTKVAILATLLLWPGYLLVVYNHGRPGANQWRLSEKIGVPANLLLALVAIIFVFRGEDLGAATRSVTVADEDGNVVERSIAKQAFRKRTILFDFDPEDLAEEELWLAGLIPDAVFIDLLGNDFFDPVGPNLFVERLRRSGYAGLTDVPLSLKRELAEELRADWIFSGLVGRSGRDYAATVRLHAASDGSLVSETSYVDADIMALIDRIGSDLRRDLGIPDRDDVPDLPVEEYFTSSWPALRAYGEARHSLLIESDYGAALEQLQEAAELDPTFALAQHSLAAVLTVSNRGAEAVAPIQAALTNNYRLPERAQFVVKADYYFIAQDIDKAWAVVEMWAELYPEDLFALQNLFAVQTTRNQRAEAIATLERIYAINSGMADVLKQIAQLHSSLGNFAAARNALERYSDRFPEDFSGLSSLAGVEINMGDFDAARANLDRALLLEPANTELMILSARLDHRVGNFAAAEDGFRAAVAAAASPAARANAWMALHTYYRVQGQTGPALEALDRGLAEAASARTPYELIATRLNNLDVYLDAGRELEARAILDEYGTQLQPPLNVTAIAGELRLALENRDAESAGTELAMLEDSIDRSQFENLRSTAVSARAELAGLQGDWDQAYRAYMDVLAASPTDPFIHIPLAGSLRELGRLDEAEQAVRKALELIPGSATANVELARIELARGRLAEARAALEHALEIWSQAEPGFEPAGEARALLETLTL